jgi:RNA polymerase sigma-70 factor (ECF subfamily)
MATGDAPRPVALPHHVQCLDRRAPLDDATGEIGDDGEARAAARLTLNVVYREMRELPEDQRVVLTLVCIDGLSYKETAETLGIPLGTVMSRLARARLALADRVDQSGARSTARIVKLW